jgi:hypothetical protein
MSSMTGSRWLAAAAAPLIATAAAQADYLGLEVTAKDISGFEDVVSYVFNLYAVFDPTPGDQVDAAGSHSTKVPAHLTLTGARFYQNPLNPSNAGRTAPPAEFVDLFPSLVVDTFLTVGLKTVPTGEEDQTGLTIDFPLEDGVPTEWGVWEPDELFLTNAAWFLFDPGHPQGQPGQADNPPGRVLIGQFSVAPCGHDDVSFEGSLVVIGVNGSSGEMFLEMSTFSWQSGGATPCRWDLDGSEAVGTADLLEMLSSWGPNPFHPADINCDGTVGTADLLDLLSNWGPCPP